MRLNADIIFQNLNMVMEGLEFEGELDEELTLFRPEFYIENNEIFLSDHVYVCSADHLPKDPKAEERVLLICLGKTPEMDMFRKSFSIIFVPEGENIFHVFNLVQEVFNRYEAWEGRMNEILRTSASVQKLIDLSREIFENPLLLIGSDFRYLAYTDKEYLEDNLGIHFEGPTFDPDLLAQFLTMHEIATDIKEPLLFDLMDRSSLSVNIFDGSQYLGCVTVFGEFRGIRSSDVRLGIYLSEIIRQAFGQMPDLAGDNSAIRNTLKNMINGQTVSSDDRRIISRYNNRQGYACICLRVNEQAGRLPAGYAASLVEQHFEGAIAFELNGDVAVVIPVPDDGKQPSFQEPDRKMTGFLEKMMMECGMSHVFSDLYDISFMFMQAQAAIEMGKRFGDDGPVFYFEDHILQKLLTQAVRGMPVRFFFTDGLEKLLRHDQTSAVSYIDTLRAFLECNMSVSQTARILHLHRSSLIDRLNHIYQLLGTDLDDRDNRLLVQMLLRSEELLEK